MRPSKEESTTGQITEETHPALWAALKERNLLYLGDRPGGFIEGWTAASNELLTERDNLRDACEYAHTMLLGSKLKWGAEQARKRLHTVIKKTK